MKKNANVEYEEREINRTQEMQLVGQGGVIIEAGPQPGYENYGYQQGFNNSVGYQENVTVIDAGPNMYPQQNAYPQNNGVYPQPNVIVEENINVQNVIIVEDNNSFGPPRTEIVEVVNVVE
jgi:hypothetical protein|tara:strand:- start:156 stop:518 length:363 start_codon:yes stop_codon:yes gene_type:complete